VVPLVDGMCEVDALVALQPDQSSAQDLGHHLGRLGLPHAGLALDEQWLLQLEREEDRGRQSSIAYVAPLAQALLDGLDRCGRPGFHGVKVTTGKVARRPGPPRRATRLAGSPAWSAPGQGASCIRGWPSGRPQAPNRPTHAPRPPLV